MRSRCQRIRSLLAIALAVTLGCAGFQARALGNSAHAQAKPSTSGSASGSAGEERRSAADASNPLDMLQLRGVAHLEEGVLVPLRDGTELMATLIVPNGASPSSRRPTILDQSPYPPALELNMGRRLGLPELVRAGYVLAVVNDRGTQWSQGEYHWLKGATADGVDVVKWITHQPWSSGSVGTWGCSSSGEVELALAKAHPPGLKAMVAMGAATGVGVIPGFADQGLFYTGGVPSFDWAWWYHGNGYWHHPKLPAHLSRTERVALLHAFSPVAFGGISEDLSWAWHLPSEDLLKSIGSPQTEFNRLITLQPGDGAWKEYDFLNAGDRTSVPTLHIDSWYDSIEVYGTTKAFQYLSGNSPDQYMIIGAGPHCSMGYETKETKVGDRPVGDARFDYAGTIVKWFDHWVRDGGHGELAMPRVQYYPLESDHWVSGDSWPPEATYRRLYLSSEGHANSLKGDGRLVFSGASGPPDRFRDDPLHPVPTLGGGCCSPDVARDQTVIEERPDVLVYTSAPLTHRLSITGYLQAVLYFSTSAPDTDIALKVIDVYPDGKAYNMLDTMQRLRYRDGIQHPRLMVPGETYRIVLRQMVTASSFAPGHRLRIEVAGSNFPEYERNMNTGGANYDESRPVIARDVIYHDTSRASYLEIPVVP